MSFQVPFLTQQRTESDVVRELEKQHCCAAPCLPCFRNLSERAIIELVKVFGNNSAADEEHRDKDYSLFTGTYKAPPDSETVELEWTRAPADNRGGRGEPYTQDECKEKQRAAANRLWQLYKPVIPLGFVNYALTLGGGYWSGWACECRDGPSPVGFVFPVLAILLLLLVLNRVTILLSQTEVEGRPLLRLLQELKGLDSYRVMALLTALDALSKFTRAQFVGYIAHCHDSIDKPFNEAFGMFLDDIVGISDLANLSFILGPICVQFGYMLFLRCKVRRELREAEERPKGQDMNIMDSMDDLAALMNWAMLTPAGKVLEMAALPIELKGDEDSERLWDGMMTKVYVYLARGMTDGVMQVTLQAAFFCLVYRQVGLGVKLQLLLNIVLAGGPAAADSIDLILMNRRITVLAGGLMLTLVVLLGVARTVGAFTCESAVLGIMLTCLPVGQVETGSWTSGTLPG